MAQETRAVLRQVGQRIREVRRSRGLTQEQAAEHLKMLTPNYARLEQGRVNMTMDTLVRLANGFGVPVGSLFRKPRVTKVKPGRPRRTPSP
jgi:XRE family transcriptional regulator, regulator of sulfur utilization